MNKIEKIRESKLSLYKTTEQLAVATNLLKTGVSVCDITLDNIRLFGFELNQSLKLSNNKKFININF